MWNYPEISWEKIVKSARTRLQNFWTSAKKQVVETFDRKPKDIFGLPLTNFFGYKEKNQIKNLLQLNEYSPTQLLEIFSQLKNRFHQIRNNRKFVWPQVEIEVRDYKELLIILMSKLEWHKYYKLVENQFNWLEEQYKSALNR